MELQDLDYFIHFQNILKKNNGKEATLFQKSVSSVFAGGIGAFVANPADLILIRMQADGTLPPEQRRNYKNAIYNIKQK